MHTSGKQQQSHDRHGASHHRHDHSGHATRDHDKHAGHSPELFRRKFWTSLLLTIPILAFDHHLQAALGFPAVIFPGSEFITPVLSVVLFVYGGSAFLVSARHELAARKPGMMTLISLAISVAFFYSVAVSIGLVGGMPLYWELATLIDIMLLGHWIEMSSIQGAGKALEHLASLVPNTAHVLHGHDIHDMDVSSVQVGSRVLVRPGEQVPLDGEITEGRSSFNESFLTGESKPVSKSEGDEVLAGAVNGEGAVTFRVTRTGSSTTLSQIQRLVDEAQSSRSQFQNLADRAASWLTYIAVGAGLLTFVTWYLSGATTDIAIIRTVAVLVMACPHALGLAIPLVIVNATSLAARHGILVRDREAFERARDIRQVAFDKTGTLTEGAFGLVDVSSSIDRVEALAIAGSLEARSEHPLAVAIAAAAKEARSQVATPTDFRVDAGRGVEGTLQGSRYYIGSVSWLRERKLELDSEKQVFLNDAEGKGHTTIVLFDDREAIAVFALGDKIKSDAKLAIQTLRSRGIESIMITGDSETVAMSVAREIGIDTVRARVLPQDKSAIVQELSGRGAIAFVGDGVNDAPALLAADLGVAIGAGTNVAIEAADLVLINSRPSDVVNAILISSATYRKMVQNLLWATGYNAIALPLAAGVAIPLGIVVSPAIGAIFMSASTVIVAINALLLRRLRLV
ncbi:MAG TPA: copper-translocating P-type ATPase [Candidatus Kapabacteria bacterium]|nr:copper-translocating P-type ATPase [Candidatus Kapabacteria bacterium]